MQLFQDFDAVSPKRWKQKIQFELNGKDYNDTLISKSPEGIHIKPFYTSEDVTSDLKIPSPTQWHIVQRIYVAQENISNQKALEFIQRGAEVIHFTLPESGLDYETLFADFPFDTTAVFCYPEFLEETDLLKLQQLLINKHNTGGIILDVIGNLAKTGNWYTGMESDFNILKKLITAVPNPHIQLGIHTELYHNAGGNSVQQLAYAIAHAHEYLHYFNEETLLPKLKFNCTIAVGTEYFFEIAKLRALRLLWESVTNLYAIDANLYIHAEPGKRNKTLYDYNVNMLRTTTECMSAVLGGANSIANQPYDAIFHKDNEFGNRIARNQLLVLKHESYFDIVTNAADGCYYIEDTTEQLAEKALILFKTIEAGGGFLAQLKNHTLQKKLKESAAEEQEAFDSQAKTLIGTNVYPNPNDTIKESLELFPFLKKTNKKTLLEPFIEKRLAETLEKQRLDNEK